VPDGALATVLGWLVPTVADWGIVTLRDGDGDEDEDAGGTHRAVRTVAARHADAAREPFMAQLLTGRSSSVDPAATAIVVEAVVDGTVLDRLAPHPEARQVWLELGAASAMVVPLVAAGRAIGEIILVAGPSGRAVEPAMLDTVSQLAQQVALLVEQTWLVREAGARAGTRGRSEVRSLLDTVLAHAPAATAILDTDLRVLHGNEAFARIGGLPAAAITDEALAEVIPDLADAIVPVARQVVATGESVDRAELIADEPGEADQGARRDGGDRRHGRDWQLSAFPILRPSGDPFGVGLLLVDVTDARRVANELIESATRLDLALAAGGLGIWDWDLTTGEVVWSGTLEEIMGLPPGGFGRTQEAFLDVVHPDDREATRAGFAAAARDGSEHHAELRVTRGDGELRWVEVRGRVLTVDPAGPERMIGVAADVTDRRLIEEIRARLLEREHEARVVAEDARERLAFVAEASATLIGTLDAQAAYEHITKLVVPRLADWCIVDARDDDGELREVALAHRQPAAEPDVRLLRRRRQELGGDGIWSVRRAVRSGSSELVLDITDADLAAVAGDDDHLAALRRLAPRSAMVVPLVARGRVLGGVTLVASGDRRFQTDDLTLAENLAARAAMAVDNARLFESRSRVARALQQTLLPPALPDIPGAEVAARYRVARGGIEIGGDFYDLFEQSDGVWVMVIGDVCGKGPEAAAVTGLFRHTLRAAAVRQPSPAGVLRLTNDAILGQIDDTRFCTAVMLRLRPEPAHGRAQATVACGGHPRPIVVRASGEAEPIGEGGTLLGVLPEPALVDVSFTLGPGDAVVLYTDGVTEARRDDELFGEARLLRVLAGAVDAGAATAAELADAVGSAVDRFQGGVANDDTAILVAHIPPIPVLGTRARW
jgi:PAS domain S-box-containing protein